MPPIYAARLTPPGAGAVAVIGLCGPGVWAVARACFTPARGTLPDNPPADRFWFGRLSADDLPADDAVLAVRPGGVVELHTHGGRHLVDWLLEALVGRGLTVCDWSEWLRHRHGDNWQAVALAELARAPTVRTAAILLDQAHGAFASALAGIADRLEADDAVGAASRLDDLLRWADIGSHLVRPWRVVLAGEPNVGKSSLANALAGYTRSVVTPLPGTTRDVVTVPLALDGWPIELADTAGLRDAADAVESAGIDRATAAAAGADLCVRVIDATAPGAIPPPADRMLVVANKCDLPASSDMPANVLRVSAVTGEGLESLAAAIVAALVPAVPPAGAAVPFTEALGAGLRHARAALADGRAVVLPTPSGDPLAGSRLIRHDA